MPGPFPPRLDHYRLLGRSGLRVSPLCLGTMTFGTDWGWGADRETSRAMFEAYAERGGNFLDTANFYTGGTSERLLGEFLGAERDRFVLATKYTLNMRRGDPNAGGNHRKCLVQSVEASLRRLDTDAIDLLWVHAWDFTTPIDEVMRSLDDLVRRGKVLYLGVSDAPAWKVAQANTLADARGWTPFVALQVEYNLVQRDVERDLVPMARELGLAVMPWSPLAGGLLTGKYGEEDLRRQQAEVAAGTAGDPFDRPQRMVLLTEQRLRIAAAVKEVGSAVGRTPAQVALQWVLRRPGVTAPILGVRRLDQLLDNLGALDFTLDEALLSRLERAGRIPLGFPHDFLQGAFVRDLVTGGTTIQ
jgi:aryl-alcohol dehydrogenase-like predicted oxidoreductase